MDKGQAVKEIKRELKAVCYKEKFYFGNDSSSERPQTLINT